MFITSMKGPFVLQYKVSHLIWRQAGGNPRVALLESAVFADLNLGVILSLPSQAITNVHEVFIVDIMQFSGTFASMASTPEKISLNFYVVNVNLAW